LDSTYIIRSNSMGKYITKNSVLPKTKPGLSGLVLADILVNTQSNGS